MTTGKIFFRLIFLSLIGLISVARWGSQHSRPSVTSIKPIATDNHQLPDGIGPLKIEAPVTGIESSATYIPAPLNLQPIPTVIEPLKIERFSIQAQLLSEEIRPLKIEPYVTTVESSSFILPQTTESKGIVENPLPNPTGLPDNVLTDAQRQRGTIRELERSLRQWKELQQIPKTLEPPRMIVGSPPASSIPRRP